MQYSSTEEYLSLCSYRWAKAQKIRVIKKYKNRLERAIKNNDMHSLLSKKSRCFLENIEAIKYFDERVHTNLRMINCILKHKDAGTSVDSDKTWYKSYVDNSLLIYNDSKNMSNIKHRHR